MDERVYSKPCLFKFSGLTCAEFAVSVQRPDAPQWMRDFAEIFCDDDSEEASDLDTPLNL